MELNTAFGLALKQIRKRKGLTQEDFSSISSRTYLSTLERGMKTPTIEKLDQLAGVLSIHPLTLLAATYLRIEEGEGAEEMGRRIVRELTSLEVDNI